MTTLFTVILTSKVQKHKFKDFQEAFEFQRLNPHLKLKAIYINIDKEFHYD